MPLSASVLMYTFALMIWRGYYRHKILCCLSSWCDFYVGIQLRFAIHCNSSLINTKGVGSVCIFVCSYVCFSLRWSAVGDMTPCCLRTMIQVSFKEQNDIPTKWGAHLVDIIAITFRVYPYVCRTLRRLAVGGMVYVTLRTAMQSRAPF